MLKRGDWVRLTYPDGAVLVGRLEEDPSPAPGIGHPHIVRLWLQEPLAGVLPIDVAGATVERVSGNG